MNNALNVALLELIEGRAISAEVMRASFTELMGGSASEAVVGGFLCALAAKGESAEELAVAAKVMRSLSTPVPVTERKDLLDTCGTGGDGAGLFNISTAAALVAAAGGARVAKHGNRAASSHSGSADVLEALGLNLELNAEQVGRCVDEVGIGFLFAPHHHSAMKAVAPTRRALGIPTLFNLLGPLANPAGAMCQLLGVNRAKHMKLMADTLSLLGCNRAMVVHSEDGLDEISISAATQVIEIRAAQSKDYRIQPTDFALDQLQSLDVLRVDTPQDSAALIRVAISPKHARERHPAASIVAMNGGAALYVAGISETLRAGVQMAEDLLCSGQVQTKLREWIELSHLCGAQNA